MLQALDQTKIEHPIVVRFDGTNAEEGRQILVDAGRDNIHVEATMLDAASAGGGAVAMTDVWSERAEAYRESDAHREGRDLELFAEWAEGRDALWTSPREAETSRAILREAGLEVVTIDSAPGMQPTVVSRAEEIPFADSSFDVVACRVAAHHFQDPSSSLKEMARVSRALVLVSDNLFMGESGEEADKLRDPTHVRNYSEDEWRAMFDGAGLERRGVRARGQADRLRGMARPIGHAGRRQRPDPRAARRPRRGRQAPARARASSRRRKR